jgi:hypothetical protein
MEIQTTITLHARKRHTSLASRLIQWWTDSPWSHVVLRVGVVCYQAHTDRGVVAEVGEDYAEPYWESWSVDVDDQVAVAIWSFLKDEVGCRYDWAGAILAAGLGIRIRSNDKWQCSELIYTALQRGFCEKGMLGLVAVEANPADVVAAFRAIQARQAG